MSLLSEGTVHKRWSTCSKHLDDVATMSEHLYWGQKVVNIFCWSCFANDNHKNILGYKELLYHRFTEG